VSDRPNLVFVMSDDHAGHAIGAYGSAINDTPHLDRLAREGMRFTRAFCTNAICTPSRAAILTGTYNHINGVTTLDTPMDNTLETYPKILQRSGYRTAVFGSGISATARPMIRPGSTIGRYSPIRASTTTRTSARRPEGCASPAM
jgi:arylsulfatase A-like enzyme